MRRRSSGRSKWIAQSGCTSRAPAAGVGGAGAEAGSSESTCAGIGSRDMGRGTQNHDAARTGALSPPPRGALIGGLIHLAMRALVGRPAPSALQQCRSRGSRHALSVLCSAAALGGPLNELLSDGGASQRLVFVGGKGGVGKTTTSSAIAVRCADEGLSTLLVSTDPAHSLSDALMQDVSGGKPIDVDGCAGLQVLEVETADALERCHLISRHLPPSPAISRHLPPSHHRFRGAVSGFRASDLGLGGAAEEILSQLGLNEFSDILDNTPPGLDELLALAEVLERVEGGSTDGGGTANVYSRIIFDTAPTGHTLRLLAFPEFLNSLVTKLIALKSRLSGAIALLQVSERPTAHSCVPLKDEGRR